jgi:hypothetical protein
MKKLILVLVLGLLWVGHAYADYGLWSCKKISNQNYKCTNTADKMNLEYIGEIKNNVPDGYGKFRVIDDAIYGEGVWKFENNGMNLVEGEKYYKGIKILYKNSQAYKFFYPSGDIFEGSAKKTSNKITTEGTMYYKNGDRYVGTIKSVWDTQFIEGIFFFKSTGDKYVGTYKNQKYFNGTYYFSNGQTYRYINSVVNNASKETRKYKKNISSLNSFMSSFILSWVFAFIFWCIIIFYFKALSSIGKITKKIDKNIPGTQEIAFYIGGAVTWYLAWALLFGFEAALLVNFVFIYLAAWGSVTVFILNKISISIQSKSGIYLILFLGACSLGLAVEMIGPFIKFLKNL